MLFYLQKLDKFILALNTNFVNWMLKIKKVLLRKHYYNYFCKVVK